MSLQGLVFVLLKSSYSRRGKSRDQRPDDSGWLGLGRWGHGIRMLIELDGVTKTYGKVTALRGLSVTLPAGSIGLLGPNGAGKTTMIRSLLGLIALDAGSG